MRIKSNSICLIILGISLVMSTGYGQGKIDGFYRGKNNASAVLGLGYEDGQEYFAGVSGDLDLSRSVFYSSVFGAYGITDNLDVNLTIPYIVSDDNANFQDVSIYLKQRIIKFTPAGNSLEFSAAAGFSTNLTDYNIGGLNDIGQQATVFDFRGVIHYQEITGWFLTLQSGYSFKTSVTPDSFPAVIKAGRATENWYFDLYFDYQHSFGGIDYLATPRPQDFRAFGVDFKKLGGTFYKPFSSLLGVYASASYVFEGRNIFRGPGYGLGLVYNFRINQPDE